MTARTPALPTVDAMGGVRPLGRRPVLIRLGLLAALLAVALVVRATGILHPAQGDQSVPPLPGAAVVLPGLLRAAEPTETELVLLRDTFGVQGVVAIGAASTEEQAAAKALAMQVLSLNVDGTAAPTAAQLKALTGFVGSAGAGGRNVVFMHDATGQGVVVVVAAMMQLLAGAPLPAVLARLTPEDRRTLNPAQGQALRDLAAVTAGSAVPDNPYAELRRTP